MRGFLFLVLSGMSASELFPPFTIRVIRPKLWGSYSNLFEIVDMNGLCVAVHYDHYMASSLCLDWNTRFGMAAKKENGND